MNNTSEKLGERIRAERLRANLTQSELSGGCVTRNMLSMIENGEATPSLETVIYLANRLCIPVGVLFAESDEDEALFTKSDAVAKARALFDEGKYVDSADVARPYPYDDELSYIFTESLLKRAEEDMSLFMLKSAALRLKEAKSAADRCRYCGKDITGTIEAYEAFISFANGRIDTDVLSRLAKAPSRIPAGYFVFLTALAALDRGDAEGAMKTVEALPYLTPDQMRYMKAREYEADFKFAKALEILLPLHESSTLGFIGKYRVVADIESCYENKRDFESAYKFSSVKHHILECFMK